MFNKTNIYLSGFLYNLKIKKIKEEDLYKNQLYVNFNGEEILNQDFISLKNFSIRINEKEESMDEFSGKNSFVNNEDLEKNNTMIKVDNLVAENLLEDLQEEYIVIEIEKYEFISPKIKLNDKNFNKHKLEIETTDLEALTDFIIDEEVVCNVKYKDKEVNYRKQGLIFIDKINKKLISKEIITYNIEDFNPCLENKYKLD